MSNALRSIAGRGRGRVPSAAALAGTVLLPFLLLAGCVTDPPPTGVPIPSGYQATRSPAAGPVASTWVRGFGSPELNRLTVAALADNTDIEAAIARIGEAQAQATIARAALYPTLGATGDVSRQQSAAGGRSGVGGGTFRFNTFDLGLNASYQVDLFGRVQYAARAADQTARASRFDRDTIALSTVASVANTYFSVLAAQDRLRIAEENLRIAQRVLDAVQGRLKVGTGTVLDTAQQESVVATQRASIPPLRQNVQQSRNTLAVLLGQTPESVSIRGGSLDRLHLPRVRAGLPSALLLRRPDIAREEANLASADANVASARAAFFPAINLTGGVGLQSAALASLFGPASLFYSVAGGLTQPIVDGYQLQGQLDLNRARSAEGAATYRKAIIQAFTDVENALVAIRELAEYEARQREAVAASRRALDVTEQRLREGTIDVVTLFTVQTTLFGNQDALALVRLQRFQAYVSLFQALGGGWTQDGAIALTQPERTSIGLVP